MSSDREQPQSGELAFARTLGLFEATMIGVGAMVGDPGPLPDGPSEREE